MIEYLKSAVEFGSIMLEAGKLVVADTVEYIDTKFANAINGEDDEC